MKALALELAKCTLHIFLCNIHFIQEKKVITENLEMPNVLFLNSSLSISVNGKLYFHNAKCLLPNNLTRVRISRITEEPRSMSKTNKYIKNN